MVEGSIATPHIVATETVFPQCTLEVHGQMAPVGVVGEHNIALHIAPLFQSQVCILCLTPQLIFLNNIGGTASSSRPG